MSYRFADSLQAGSGCSILHVSDSSCVHHQEFFTVNTAVLYVIQVCWQLASRIRMSQPTCFGQFLCPSSGVFHCTHSSGICHTGLGTACKQDQDVPIYMFPTVPVSIIRSFSLERPDPACKLSANLYDIPLLCVQWKTSDEGQRNCPKHVEFHSKNKFEKLVHLVGLIIINYCRSTNVRNVQNNTTS